MDKPEYIGTCEVCGEYLHDDDDFYELPGGTYLCGNDYDCLEEWAEQYLHKPVIYCN